MAFTQRVEDNAFHLAAISQRWIGFSEDDDISSRPRLLPRLA
jgi:hypothetical protein